MRRRIARGARRSLLRKSDVMLFIWAIYYGVDTGAFFFFHIIRAMLSKCCEYLGSNFLFCCINSARFNYCNTNLNRAYLSITYMIFTTTKTFHL